MNIERHRGDTAADKFTLTRKDTWEAANLVGCSFLLTLDSRESPTDSGTQIYQLTGEVSSPTSGVVEFSPSALQADLAGTYYYDMVMIDAFGKRRTLVSGIYRYIG